MHAIIKNTKDGKMPPWIKNSLYKHEDPSSHPKNPSKSWTQWCESVVSAPGSRDWQVPGFQQQATVAESGSVRDLVSKARWR